jgi:hypothetical protein
MNGQVLEAAIFTRQWSRQTSDLELRRELAMIRRVEQQLQKNVNWLIPKEESDLETTLGYEQVAVDLTAYLAQNEPDEYVKQALDFAQFFICLSIGIPFSFKGLNFIVFSSILIINRNTNNLRLLC